MAKSTILKVAERVEEGNAIPVPYQMNIEDIIELKNVALHGEDGFLGAVITAFNYGFAMGNHATINRKLKKV